MISLILLVFALVLFILAGLFALPATEPWRAWARVFCFGLACWVASELISRGPALLGGGR